MRTKRKGKQQRNNKCSQAILKYTIGNAIQSKTNPYQHTRTRTHKGSKQSKKRINEILGIYYTITLSIPLAPSISKEYVIATGHENEITDKCSVT